MRDAFRARGHDAWSCDLEPCEGDPAHHLQCDLFQAADPAAWDLFVVHPECRYLSVSGYHWNYRRPERMALTEQALDFAKRCFELCAKFKKAMLENPVSILSTRVRRPDQVIQPHWFGEDASKSTCLWLHNLPLLVPTKMFPPRMANGKPRWSNQTDSGQNRLGPSEKRSMDRARTYRGVAAAMAEQWS